MAKLIGTAGHVDHGKTTLIQALTGIDADRLPEEKRRGMTIEIGFAYVDLPDLGRVSIVDVPGHERFIGNMLVGALGIDVALLCVAADESVKPQTREHVAILRALGVERFVVALTRADLADEPMRVASKHEVAELVPDAPLIEVSAPRGLGIEELKNALAKALRDAPEKSLTEAWYMPIDRVFVAKGHGLVVTGTMARGKVEAGGTVVIEPGGHRGRIRGIQIHGEESDSSEAGKRTALNLTGVKHQDIVRGMVVGSPDAIFVTTVLDARMRWTEMPKHGLRVRLAIGAEEAIGRIFLSAEEPDVAQLRLETPIACALGQPIVVRRYSPPDLIAGGNVVVPVAKPRKQAEKLDRSDASDPRTAILDLVGDRPEGLPTEEICRMLGSTPQKLGDVFEDLRTSGKLIGFAGLWLSPQGAKGAMQRFLTSLGGAHQSQPKVPYHAKERIVAHAGLNWAGKPLDRLVAALQQLGKVETNGGLVKLVGFRMSLTDRQRQFLDRVVTELESELVNTPNAHQLAQRLGVPIQATEEILKLGLEAGELVRLDEGVWYTPGQLKRLIDRVREVADGKPFAAAQVRDALATSRKYVIPLLEMLDRTQTTIRTGETRIFLAKPPKT